jgi:hypothetical protein
LVKDDEEETFVKNLEISYILKRQRKQSEVVPKRIRSRRTRKSLLSIFSSCSAVNTSFAGRNRVYRGVPVSFTESCPVNPAVSTREANF